MHSNVGPVITSFNVVVMDVNPKILENAKIDVSDLNLEIITVDN